VQAYYDRTNRGEANLKDLRNTFDIDFCKAEVTGARSDMGTRSPRRAREGY